MRTNILLSGFLLLLLASCVKQRACTCDAYRQSFEDEYDPVTGMAKYNTANTLYQQATVITGSKKQAKNECQKLETTQKQHARDIGADDSKVSCQLK